MSVSITNQITIKTKSIVKFKKKKPVSCHTYSVLFATIFIVILFKRLA